jgi:hypothetical protein
LRTNRQKFLEITQTFIVWLIGTSQHKGVTEDFDNNWLYDVNNRNIECMPYLFTCSNNLYLWNELIKAIIHFKINPK